MEAEIPIPTESGEQIGSDAHLHKPAGVVVGLAGVGDGTLVSLEIPGLAGAGRTRKE
jgi:hypothetical protein